MSGPGRLDPSRLQAAGIHTVVLAGVDLYGRLFGKRTPARRFPGLLADGMHVCTSVYGWDVTQDVGELRVDYTGGHTGWPDFRLVPDLATLRRAAWLEGTAICLGDSRAEHSDALVPIAPRSVLLRTVGRLADAGLTALAATELEFHLYRGTPAELRASGYRELRPTTETHADYTIDEGDRYEPFFGRLRQVLEQSGIPVEVVQAEYGHGQWELNLEHAGAVEMADRHAVFKHVVRHLAATAGMTATFMARPLTDGMGSSCHVHVSLQDLAGTPLFHDPAAEQTITPALRHAVGGLLRHTPELMPFYAPTVNSMRRLLTQDFAGNGLTWGVDNRTTTCRVITGAPSANRLEMRLPGADVNPYLALSAVLASVAAGLRDTVDPGPQLHGDGYAGPAEDRLPMTLDAASRAMRAGGLANAALGKDVVGHYCDLADHEWRQFLRAVPDWDRARYLEVI